jgi:hypothetical protein
VEEIEPPAARLEARQAVARMADIAATRIPDEAAVPVSANDLPTPRSLGLLEQSAAALAVPRRNVSIEDAGEVLALSAANLSENTSTEDVGEVLLQSIAGLQVAAHPDGVIDDSMERLTEQLAALCLERLEGGVNVSASNMNEEMDVKVRDKH